MSDLAAKQDEREWRKRVGKRKLDMLGAADAMSKQGFKFLSADDCPDAEERHYPLSDHYVFRAEQKDELSKTHVQERCPTCGFWAVWRPEVNRCPLCRKDLISTCVKSDCGKACGKCLAKIGVGLHKWPRKVLT